VRPLQLEVVAPGSRRAHGVTVRKFQGVGNSTFVLSVETKMTSGQDVSEFLDILGLVKSYFLSFLGGKKNREFFFAPEDQAICLFAGLLVNPDMALSHLSLYRFIKKKIYTNTLCRSPSFTC
jgi:hypothetical protein